MERKICTNCVMDTTDSNIVFDSNGVCDHCHNFYNNIQPNWHIDDSGKCELDAIVSDIKKAGKGKKYNCIIGLSGGMDSSYLAYIAVKKLNLKPLIISVDTGWDLPIAKQNCNNIIDGLNLRDSLVTVKIDTEQMMDLQLAYFKSSVPYQDTPQDHVIFASLYNTAVKYGIKYVLTGGNYSTECVREPNEWVYWNDMRMIKDIHRRFGTKPMNKLPQCSMFKHRLYYRYFKGMRIVKPLNMIPYIKKDALSLLQSEFNYQPYKNKHYESIFTRFYEGWWLIKKFGYDKRKAHFSSLVLTGQMTREQALSILSNPPYSEQEAMEDMQYIVQKLGISKEEFLRIMELPNKSYKDYKNSFGIINLAIRAARLFGIERMQYR